MVPQQIQWIFQILCTATHSDDSASVKTYNRHIVIVVETGFQAEARVESLLHI